MGQIIQMAWTGLATRNKYITDQASLGGQKTMGKAQIDVDNLLATAQANAANALRGDNNTLLAAKAALGNLQRSAKNEAVLQNAGAKYNAASTNMLRIADSNSQGSLERRLQDAEQQGAVTAAAAASGTGGASSRLLKMTLAATSARREARITTKQGQQSYDMLAQRAGIVPGAIMALDEGQTFAPIDHTVSVAHQTIDPLWQRDFMPTAFYAVGQAIGGDVGQAAYNLYQNYDSRPKASPDAGYNPQASPSSSYEYNGPLSYGQGGDTGGSDSFGSGSDE